MVKLLLYFYLIILCEIVIRVRVGIKISIFINDPWLSFKIKFVNLTIQKIYPFSGGVDYYWLLFIIKYINLTIKKIHFFSNK